MLKWYVIGISIIGMCIGSIILAAALALGTFSKGLEGSEPLVDISLEERDIAMEKALHWIGRLNDGEEVRGFLTNMSAKSKTKALNGRTLKFKVTPSYLHPVVDAMNHQNIIQNEQLHLSHGLLLALKKVANIDFDKSVEKIQTNITKYTTSKVKVYIHNPEIYTVCNSKGECSTHVAWQDYEFEYDFPIIQEVERYNGTYTLDYEKKTTVEIQLVESEDQVYEREIKIEYPVPISTDFDEDYDDFHDLIKAKGIRKDEERLFLYRQAFAYDPLFFEPKMLDHFALELFKSMQLDGIMTDSFDLFDFEMAGGMATGRIPAQYADFYKDAGKEYNIPWSILASIHYQETRFGLNLGVSSAGAIGHMQFIPATWEAYGVDADGDGRADPYNPMDAIYSAAHYLSANLKASGSMSKAIYAYNHDNAYVNEVLSRASLFMLGERHYTSHVGFTGDASEKAKAILDTAFQYLGQKKYVWGRGRTPQDVRNGLFDCSSWVAHVFNLNGVNLYDSYTSNYYGVTTRTLVHLGNPVSESQAMAGDLIFYEGHVGIYLGDGTWIGYQNSGNYIAKVRTSYWGSSQKPLLGFRRVLN